MNILKTFNIYPRFKRIDLHLNEKFFKQVWSRDIYDFVSKYYHFQE
jgi:hypothetical protein